MRKCVRNLTEARYAKRKLFQCLSKVVSGVSTPNLDKCMMPIRDIPWNFAKNVCLVVVLHTRKDRFQEATTGA